MSEHDFNRKILETLQGVLPKGRPFIGLHEPVFEGREHEYVKSCLDTRWVSYAGEYVQEFDRKLAEYCGVKHAVCVASGTAALHMALLVAGARQGDEVLMPALTFVATANAAAQLGAVPHFIDSDMNTLGVDPRKLSKYLEQIADSDVQGACINKNTGARIAAIVPVHVFGHPCDMDAIVQIARRYNIPLITDAAESLGSLYKGKPSGSFGDLATLSFNGNKIITTGGGGAVLTDDDELAARVRHLSTTAKIKHSWRFIHDEVGYNIRMPNINAALGVAGLEYIDELLAAKRELAQSYETAFAPLEGVQFIKEPDFAVSNYWLNALLLDEDKAENLEALLELANSAAVMTRPVWDLMNSLPMYKNCPSMVLETAQDLARRLINIPSSAFLAPSKH